MSDRQFAIDVIRQLPLDASLEEIRDEIDLLIALRRSQQEADGGRVIPHAEVVKWLASHFPKHPSRRHQAE